MKDVGVEQVQGIAQELVPVPGGDPDVEQRILPVLHGVGQVKGQGIGEHQAQDDKQQQGCCGGFAHAAPCSTTGGLWYGW